MPLQRRILIGLICLSATYALATENQPAAKKLPTQVTIASMPPVTLSQPAEVKVTSMPALPAPRVNVELPKDESAAHLVTVTWWLVIVTGLLAVSTFVVAGWASRDSKRRDRDAMMREVSRSAHKIMVEVARLKKLAQTVPTVRSQLHILVGQGGLPPGVKEQTEKDLQGRIGSLDSWNSEAGFVIADQSDGMAPILRLSDKELAARLWRLDTLLVGIEGMREDITHELEQYESASSERRQSQTAMQAAALAGKLSRPLKSKLGE